MLRFQVLGASFARFWGLRCRDRVLRFRDRALRFRVFGASFSRFGCFVFEVWVLRASVFVFECSVFESTATRLQQFNLSSAWNQKEKTQQSFVVQEVV